MMTKPINITARSREIYYFAKAVSKKRRENYHQASPPSPKASAPSPNETQTNPKG